MSIRWRPMRPKDVEQCVSFTAANPALLHRYGNAIRQLAQVWLDLLGRHCFGAVITDEVINSSSRLLAVSAAAFVTESFVKELKTPPSFWIVSELVDRFTRGQSPFLSDKAVREANATNGLNLLVWQNGVLPGEMHRPEVPHAVMRAFLDNYRGYRLNEFCNQAESMEDLIGLRAMGARFFDIAIGRWTEIPVESGHSVLRRPHVVGLKPESLEDRMSYAGLTFLYQPPQFGFSWSEQQLLLNALPGANDEELSAALEISVAAVKKTWRRVYNRVAEKNRDLLPNHLSPSLGTVVDRGKEKRRRLLFYLREHPEELRPVSRKLLANPEASCRGMAG